MIRGENVKKYKIFEEETKKKVNNVEVKAELVIKATGRSQKGARNPSFQTQSQSYKLFTSVKYGRSNLCQHRIMHSTEKDYNWHKYF